MAASCNAMNATPSLGDSLGTNRNGDEQLSEAESDSTGLLSDVAKFIQYTAFDLLQEDPHQWSTRPCTTCQTISILIKRPFGCVLYTKEG